MPHFFGRRFSGQSCVAIFVTAFGTAAIIAAGIATGVTEPHCFTESRNEEPTPNCKPLLALWILGWCTLTAGVYLCVRAYDALDPPAEETPMLQHTPP